MMNERNAALSAEDLIAWNDANARDWYALASERPDVLAVPCDIYKVKTVGELLQHIVAAELRYAERLSDAQGCSASCDAAWHPALCATCDARAATWIHIWPGGFSLHEFGCDCVKCSEFRADLASYRPR